MVIGHKLVVSLRAFPVEKIETSTDILMGLMETVMYSTKSTTFKLFFCTVLMVNSWWFMVLIKRFDNMHHLSLQ